MGVQRALLGALAILKSGFIASTRQGASFHSAGAGATGAEIAVFRIDASFGTLTPVGSPIGVPSPSFVGVMPL